MGIKFSIILFLISLLVLIDCHKHTNNCACLLGTYRLYDSDYVILNRVLREQNNYYGKETIVHYPLIYTFVK